MNRKFAALISTISNSFCDFSLDIAVNKFQIYKILLYTSIGSGILQFLYGLIIGIKFTIPSLFIILFYGFNMLLGYAFYVASLKKLPVGLVGIIESGSLFGFLIIDSFLGYIKLTPYFILLFIIFIISIFLFSYDSYRLKDSIKNKNIKLNGLIFVILYNRKVHLLI